MIRNRRRAITGFGGAPEPPIPGDSFLSTYPGALAAWSLRQLGDTEVDVIRVRRSSDNAEEDFNPTEIGDGTLTTWAGTTAYVATWYDQSGNGNNATQSNASAQPLIVSGGSVTTDASGQPALDFVGGGNGFTTPIPVDSFDTTLENPSNFLIVAKNNSNFEIFVNMEETSVGDVGLTFLNGNSSSGVAMWEDGVQLNHSLTSSGTWCVQGGFYTDGATYTRYMKSLTNPTASSRTASKNFTPPASTYFIGIGAKNGITGSGTSPFEGELLEIIIWQLDMFSQLSDVETDISEYYIIS